MWTSQLDACIVFLDRRLDYGHILFPYFFTLFRGMRGYFDAMSVFFMDGDFLHFSIVSFVM
jgi:hypothetical protein